MKRRYTILIALCLTGYLARAQNAPVRKITPFDKTWLFYKGDASGAEKSSFADAQWRKLDVPHDWMIEGPYAQDNPTGRGGGYLPADIGWYRKHFDLDAADAGKQVYIEFDGVMANSDVWINGHHLGKRPYGYISFQYDLTGHLNFGKGKTNIIAVRADNSLQPASRYYTGAGIYRHVRLITVDPVHIDNYGVFVTTPKVSAENASVHIKTTVQNSSSSAQTISVMNVLYDAAGKIVSSIKREHANHKIDAGKTVTDEDDDAVVNPRLWDVNLPTQYKLVTTVIQHGKVLDEKTTWFGIRTIQFTADQGFLLNGKKLMIKGVCLHHDMGALGAAVPLRAWERRLEILKSIGVNGIRTSHNPVAPEFLDLCDRMGLVVMDESFDTWEANKVSRGPGGGGGYNLYFKEWSAIDQADQIKRDRNHPSVVIYSVGNEIHDNLGDSSGFRKYRTLQNIVHANDDTRPVTMALLRPNTTKVYDNGFAKMMDVVGQNYRENELVAAHEAHPDWKVIGTENGHTLQAWLEMRNHPYYAGQFLWVGVDYLGESDWPNVVNGQGVFDRTTGVRPLSLQRESWWSEKPVVHIVRSNPGGGRGANVTNDWTPADPDNYKDAKVSVYSNCDEVELFLNGKSLGSKTKPADDAPRDWQVTYEKGSIKAVAKNNGQVVATEELKTAGTPARIILSADHTNIKNDWDDLSYITAQVVDANGVPCPMADNELTFTVSGPGTIAATDNADLANHEIFAQPVRHAYHGKAIAIVKGSGAGKVTVKANAAGLTPGSVELIVK